MGLLVYFSNAMAETKLSYTSFSSCVSVDGNNLMSYKYLLQFTAIKWQTHDVY